MRVTTKSIGLVIFVVIVSMLLGACSQGGSSASSTPAPAVKASTPAPAVKTSTPAPAPADKPPVNMAKLVSDVRSVFENLTDKIDSDMEDLESLHQTVVDKKDKISWMSRDARMDEEQRLKELRDSGMVLISQLQVDLNELDTRMTSEVSSVRLASSGSNTGQEELEEQAEKVQVYIKTTLQKIKTIEEFFSSIN